MYTAEDTMVDALEDGRIVRVTEAYARREGLMILRKHEESALNNPAKQEQMKLTPRLRGERKAYFDIDKYRRPLRDKNEILASLVDNFHWMLSSKRKQLNMSRKQVAQALGVQEDDIKMLETGILPHNDYILINKLENYLKITLRRDKSIGNDLKPRGVEGHVSKPKWEGKIGRKPIGYGIIAEEIVDDEIELDDTNITENSGEESEEEK